MEDSHRIARLRALVVPATLLALSAPGCSGERASRRPIPPFGAVQTYNSTVVPGPIGHPRGKMVLPQAPGIDLVKRPAFMDSTPPGLTPRDPSALPAVAIGPGF